MESDTGEGGRRGGEGKERGRRTERGRRREGRGGEGGRHTILIISLLHNGLRWTHVEVVVVYIHTHTLN